MRFGFWAVAALVFGALLAHFLLQDKGLVTISMRDYVVTMSVPVLAVMLVAAYFLIRLAIGIWHAPRRLGAGIAERRSRSAGKRLTRGLIHLSEGEWARSERLLTRSIGSGDAPLANYLMAARAAQQQGAIERRNDWLRRAFEELPDAESAILMTQAQLQLENGESEPAIATLRRVREKQPHNTVANAMLARTCRDIGDAAGVLSLLPELVDADLPESERDGLACFALEAERRKPDFDRSRLDALWKGLPGALCRRPQLKAWRARALSALGDGDTAEAELRKALNRQWQPELAAAYGQVRIAEPARQLRHAESWLKSRPDDATLLLAAARICMQMELWGKARSYLEASLSIAPDPGGWAIYGQLLRELGEDAAAGEAFRQGLSIAGNVELDVPLLAPAGTETTAAQ